MTSARQAHLHILDAQERKDAMTPWLNDRMEPYQPLAVAVAESVLNMARKAQERDELLAAAKALLNAVPAWETAPVEANKLLDIIRKAEEEQT